MKFFKAYQLEKALEAEQEKYRELQVEYDAELTKTANLTLEVDKLKSKLRSAEGVIESQEKALQKAVAAVRAQTEADLILDILRLLEIVPSRSKKKVIQETIARQKDWTRLDALAQQQLLHGSPPQSSLAESLLGLPGRGLF